MESAIKTIGTTIATIILIAYVTGNKQIVWNQLVSFRKVVIKEMRQDWGCPSLWNKHACD